MVLAGRDLEQMGTWLGVSKEGRFSAVTNYRNGKDKNTALLSRGNLTKEFLTGSDSASDFLNSLSHTKQNYGGFNLLLGDDTGLYYSSNRGAESIQLTPGIYGLSNAFLDTPWPKLLKAKENLQAVLNTQVSLDSLANILSSREIAADDQLPDTGISQVWERLLSSCFIHSAEYGTRATTVLRQRKDGLTELIETSYGTKGFLEERRFSEQLPLIGNKV
jgi:uncharacterized protein with NRDE domain